MGCAGAGNCQLVRKRDCGDCKEISLTSPRLLSLDGNNRYKWIKELIGKLIGIYVEWMAQRRRIGGQRDEEHDLEVTQSPAPATTEQTSTSEADNNRVDQVRG